MDGGKRAGVARVQKLQEVEGFATTDFAQENPIGPVPQCRFQEIADRYRRHTVLCLPSLKAHQVRLRQLNFGSVLDQQDTFVGWNELSKRV